MQYFTLSTLDVRVSAFLMHRIFHILEEVNIIVCDLRMYQFARLRIQIFWRHDGSNFPYSSKD